MSKRGFEGGGATAGGSEEWSSFFMPGPGAEPVEVFVPGPPPSRRERRILERLFRRQMDHCPECAKLRAQGVRSPHGLP